MSDLPARIWLTYEIANVHWLAFDEAPTDPHDNARDEYVRADLADAWAKERDRLRADLASAREREQRMREAMDRIAAWDDHGANRALERDGTYGRFDEPGSVQIARAALSAMRGEP